MCVLTTFSKKKSRRGKLSKTENHKKRVSIFFTLKERVRGVGKYRWGTLFSLGVIFPLFTHPHILMLPHFSLSMGHDGAAHLIPRFNRGLKLLPLIYSPPLHLLSIAVTSCETSSSKDLDMGARDYDCLLLGLVKSSARPRELRTIGTLHGSEGQKTLEY